MRIKSAHAVGAVAAVLAVVGMVYILLPEPVPAETALVENGTFVAAVEEDGKTRIRDRYVVYAPLAGRLGRVSLNVGDPVTGGEALAAIIPSPAPLLDPRTRREAQERLGTAEAAVERVRALLETARAQAQQAAQELARTRTLRERGAATAQALERAELAKSVADRDLRAAEFQLDAAEHDLAQARALLDRYSDSADAGEVWNITAPVSGVVLRVAQESETIVQPGTPIIEIGDPGDLEVVVDVLSTDAVEITPDAEVSISGWGGAEDLSGRVRHVEPGAFTKISTLGVEEQRVNVIIDITSPPEKWTGLGDAFQVDARITVFSLNDATMVPAGALFRKDGNWSVFVVEDGRARLRQVSVIRRTPQMAAIGEGLAHGERVIIYPGDQIADGVRVE